MFRKMLVPELMLLLPAVCFSFPTEARKIAFSYDAAGNRVKRELVITQPSAAPDRSTGMDHTYHDLLGDRTVTFTNTTSGLINISVSELKETDEASVDVYSISGITVISSPITALITSVDLTSQPVGVYVLKVNINGELTIWKITKQ